MACNTLSLAASSPASMASLSSAAAPFVAPAASAPPAMLAPFNASPLSVRSLSVTCSLSEKDVPVAPSGKALLTSLVAAGAALSVFATGSIASPPAMAATGPGGSGAERTAEKSQELLRAADKLNIEDAPKRYGPGSVTSDQTQDAGKVAQEAAGKTLSQIQNGISSIEGTLAGKKDEVQSATDSAVNQAQSTVEDATSGSGISSDPLASIKSTIEGIKDKVVQKDADAKSKLDDATKSTGLTQ